MQNVPQVPFTFHEDPGHGWLQVSFAQMADVGLAYVNFSHYSFKDNHAVYLEEDCDFSRFAKAYEEKHGTRVPYTVTYHDHDCFVRNLPRIKEAD